MKVQELVSLMNNSKNKLLKAEQIQEVLKKTLEVTSYMSIKDKKKLVDSIVDECILYEDGVFKFDEIDKYICFTMRTIEAYTNLELSTDFEEDYDVLCRSKLLNSVIETFNGEYENIKLLLQMKSDYILSNNTMEAQLGRFLDEILNKVDIIADMLKDKVDGFDINNLPISAKDINKLMDIIGYQKK